MYTDPFDPYPIRALPDIARGAVEDIANLVQVSNGLAGAAVLTVMSVAVQRSFKVVLPSTLSAKPVGLYLLTAASAGDGKSPTDELAMQPIREHDASAQEQYEVRLKYYRAQREVWSNKKRMLLANDVEDAEATKRMQRHFDAEPKMPKCNSLLSQDISERALLEALDGSGRSQGIVCDEGKILFKDSFVEKVGVLNSAWSGNALQLERANRLRLDVQDPRVSMSIMVQPGVLQEYMAKRANTTLRESGFFSRCLVSTPRSTQGYRWRDAHVPTRARLDAFHDRIREILHKGDAREASRAEDVLLEFDADAAHRWIQIANDYEVQMQPQNGGYAIKDYLSKASEQIARIAALLHVIADQPSKITSDTVERARSLVSYHANEYWAMFVPPPPPPIWIKDSQKLDGYLLREYWSTGKIFRVSKNLILRKGPVRGKDRLDPALAALIGQGKIFLWHDEKHTCFICLNLQYGQAVMPYPVPLTNGLCAQ